jgi:nicotinate phosphoribosyltransferase
VLPCEPLLTVKGPEELIAHFEHVFHRLFYSTLVATRAHELLKIIEDPMRFIEVGKRGAITEQQHHQALRAMEIGAGFTLTSNDCGLGLGEFSDVGTIGHRYVQRFPSEEQAFRHAIENLPAVTLLVDLIDTYKGIDLSLKLKDEYRSSGKKIWVRLDSGDIKDQVRYFLAQSQEKGMTDPVLDRVVVEGVESIEEIAEIEEMVIREFGQEARKRVLYGAGGLLISEQVSRKDASTGYKLSQYTDTLGKEEPTLKKSNSPGKESLPGEPRLAIVDGKRVVVQPGEELVGDVVCLFEPLLAAGKNYCYAESAEEAKARRKAHARLLDLTALTRAQLKGLRAQPSAKTKALIDAVCEKYEMAMSA